MLAVLLVLYILQASKRSTSFVIGPSDAKATSTLIAIISLSVAYPLKYFTLLLT